MAQRSGCNFAQPAHRLARRAPSLFEANDTECSITKMILARCSSWRFDYKRTAKCWLQGESNVKEKRVLVFQTLLTERARTGWGERDDERRRGWRESKEHGSAGWYFCLLFLWGEVVYGSVLPWACTVWKPLPCPTRSCSSSFSLCPVSWVSCWAFVPGA